MFYTPYTCLVEILPLQYLNLKNFVIQFVVVPPILKGKPKGILKIQLQILPLKITKFKYKIIKQHKRAFSPNSACILLNYRTCVIN